MYRPTVALGFVLSLAGGAPADEWATPDGVLKVTAPNPARFTREEPVPPAVVQWATGDRTTMINIAVIPDPDGGKPQRAAIEAAFLRSLPGGGTLLASSTAFRNGHMVEVLAGRGEAEGAEFFSSVALLYYGGKIYRVAAVSKSDLQADPDVTAFIDSVWVVVPPPGASPVVVVQQPPMGNQQNATDRFAQGMGSMGVFLLFICGVLFLFLKLKPRPKPRRRRRDEDEEDEEDDRPRRRRRGSDD